MPSQKSLFDDDPNPAAVPALAVKGSAGHLTREQKQFNKLIVEIAATRNELARWRVFADEMHQRNTRELAPLFVTMREKRKQLVAVYDHALDGKGLAKRERGKLIDIICSMLGELIAEGEEPELIRLYDKYSEISYEDEQGMQADLMSEMASTMFGVKLDKADVTGSAAETAQRIADKVDEAESARAARRATRARKKDPRAAQREEARQAAQEEEARNITKSVREVYRKLASELHPDREPDPAERERKTQLMQKVNKAYNEGDLLALLELQLELEQINPDNLASMARERLLHFNAVLAEQLHSLHEEMDELITPFMMNLDPGSAHNVTPERLRQTLDADVLDMQRALREIDRDITAHQDLANLKQMIKHHRISRVDQELEQAMAEMDFLMAMAPSRPRGARGARGAPGQGGRGGAGGARGPRRRR